jgi:hypothetical protein
MGLLELGEGYITERGEEFVRIDTQVLYNEFSMACMLSYATLLHIIPGIHIHKTRQKTAIMECSDIRIFNPPPISTSNLSSPQIT